MTPEQFTYWLQGFAEIHGGAPSEKQWLVVKDHLKLVFEKKTPDRSPAITSPGLTDLHSRIFQPQSMPLAVTC